MSNSRRLCRPELVPAQIGGGDQQPRLDALQAGKFPAVLQQAQEGLLHHILGVLFVFHIRKPEPVDRRSQVLINGLNIPARAQQRPAHLSAPFHLNKRMSRRDALHPAASFFSQPSTAAMAAAYHTPSRQTKASS